MGLLTKVIAGRFGSGLGTFFFGFFTSRLRASLFPMRIACHSFVTLQLARKSAKQSASAPDRFTRGKGDDETF